MKVPKAKKLPSGNWRVQMLIDGSRTSITGPAKEAAVLKAIEMRRGVLHYQRDPLTITLKDAF